MAFPVDYSGDHVVVDGVENGTLVTQGGAQVDIYPAIRNNGPRPDFSGGPLELSPQDVVFVLWGYAPSGGVDENAQWTWGGVDYNVVSGSVRRDGAMSMIVARRRS